MASLANVMTALLMLGASNHPYCTIATARWAQQWARRGDLGRAPDGMTVRPFGAR